MHKIKKGPPILWMESNFAFAKQTLSKSLHRNIVVSFLKRFMIISKNQKHMEQQDFAANIKKISLEKHQRSWGLGKKPKGNCFLFFKKKKIVILMLFGSHFARTQEVVRKKKLSVFDPLTRPDATAAPKSNSR